jgi:hypothetical protein
MIRLNPGKKAYLEDIDGNVLRIRMQGDITEYYAFAGDAQHESCFALFHGLQYNCFDYLEYVR